MTKETKEDIDDIAVVEEQDGSATVELPDHIESPHNEGGEVSAASDDGDSDQPGDTDAIREARRNRRRAKKEYIKRTHVEKDAKLTLLERQNQQLVERLSVLERKQSGADLARFDKAIEDEQLRLQ
jgi:tRNA uridine 5-carbamoylmethylation protein Kti12